jgi:hypothetical protein
LRRKSYLCEKVEAFVGARADGSHAVLLFRYDQPTNAAKVQRSAHGAYGSWEHARDVAHQTVVWINDAIAAHGAVREEDVEEIHQRAENSIARRYASRGWWVGA